MAIETLGEAWNQGWRIHVRCLDDGREGDEAEARLRLSRGLGYADARVHTRPGFPARAHR